MRVCFPNRRSDCSLSQVRCDTITTVKGLLSTHLVGCYRVSHQQAPLLLSSFMWHWVEQQLVAHQRLQHTHHTVQVQQLHDNDSNEARLQRQTRCLQRCAESTVGQSML